MNISKSAQCLEDYFQTILIFDRVNVLSIESKANLYQRVYMINQTDEFCSEYKQAINDNKLKFHIIKLKNCKIINDVLFKKKIYYEFLRTCTRNYYKKCMINLQFFILTINESLI